MITIVLTEKGKRTVNMFLAELAEKRKEILDAGEDTADDTYLPEVGDIISDIESFGDEEGYWNCWGCTDDTKYDMSIGLVNGIDYIIENRG